MELVINACTTHSACSGGELLQRHRPEPVAYLHLAPHSHPKEVVLHDNSTLIIDPEDFRAGAAGRLKEQYSDFTLRFAFESGFADLYRWRGKISWWWFTEFSENSPLRTPLIKLLYWLLIIEMVLDAYTITRLSFVTDDSAFAKSLRDLANNHGVEIGGAYLHTNPLPAHRTDLKARFRRSMWLSLFVNRIMLLLNWLIVRLARLRPSSQQWNAWKEVDVLMYSRFPVLWEQEDKGMRERMYGDLPSLLEAQGHSILYGAILSLNPYRLLRHLSIVRKQIRANNVVLLESLWSLSDVIRICFNFGPMWRYPLWRRQQNQQPICFAGIDIRSLLLRELDSEVTGREFSTDLGIYLAIRKLLVKLKRTRCVFHPFEYQPMERAVRFGVKDTDQEVSVVGLQTGIFPSNQLGFLFPSDRTQQFAIQKGGGLDQFPLPDILVAYGRLAYDVWCERVGSDRVVLAGPVEFRRLRTHRLVNIRR